jgi:DNA polymerase III alpha subunit
MDNIPAYIRRKHGQEAVTYLHPLLEPYLRKTYGIFVYQEDIMAAAIALGGFTGPEADTLGYAIRKKKRDVLQAQKSKFVQRAAERGVPPQTIDAVSDGIPQGELHRRVHDVCSDRGPRHGRQGRGGHCRVPPPWHRGPPAGRP